VITFACPHCKKSLSVKDEFAGKTGKCPHCKATSQVPASSVPTDENKAKTVEREETLAPAANAREVDTHAGTPGQKKNETDEFCDFLAPAQASDELGRLGPYRVLKILGAGGMGVVYEAEDPLLKRKVALKAMLPSLAVSESARQRFLREAQAAASIEHDHIVHIYQVGEDRGIPYIAMQFLKGEELDERLKREKRLPVKEVVRIGRETALGLAAAHAHGLVHRDIKPANIWLEILQTLPGQDAVADRVKILDFGLARAAAGDNANLTQAGAIMGTPSYMAPEQANGLPVDARCDLFSLGCVLYRMSTGKLPFKGTDSLSTLVAVASQNPEPPAEIDPSVPKRLSNLIMKLLAKSPDDRPANAAEVAESLGKVLQSSGPTDDWIDVEKVPKRRFDDDKTQLGSKKRADDPPRRKSQNGGIPAWLVVIGIAAVLFVVLGGVAAFFVIRAFSADSKSSRDGGGRVASESSSDSEDNGGSESSDPMLPGSSQEAGAPDVSVDADVQGMYVSKGSAAKAGCHVIGLGNGHFQAVYYPGGLPGHGWDGENRVLMDGSRDGNQILFSPAAGTRTYMAPSPIDFCATAKFPPTGQRNYKGTLNSKMILKVMEEGTNVFLHKANPGPKLTGMGKEPPRDAVVLFNGTNTDAWDGGTIDKDTKALVPNGKDIRTKQKFNNYSLHLEFMLPFNPEKRAQVRTNSGVFQVDTYEVQILDSFGLEGKADECGAVFGRTAPKVNMCYAPLMWQTFDIDFTNAVRQNDKVAKKAKFTIKQNGVLIIDNQEIPGPTVGGRKDGEGTPGPIQLQYRSSPAVQFRNIWLVEKK
jgi:serine/threonine protein kinase